MIFEGVSLEMEIYRYYFIAIIRTRIVYKNIGLCRRFDENKRKIKLPLDNPDVTRDLVMVLLTLN